MKKVRLGQVDYINCIPVYQAFEEKQINLDVNIVKGPPTVLNKMFLAGDLDITPISSIEYARHTDQSIILPNLSICADGKVMSILFFSKIAVTELDGKKVCLTSSSATSVALLKILFEHYYHVNVEFVTTEPSLDTMLDKADGALLIGDDALIAHTKLKKKNENNIIVTDLGEVWKQFTGERMIYALWVIRKDYALKNPELVNRICDALMSAKIWGSENQPFLVNIVKNKHKLKVKDIKEYFKTIVYDFSEEAQKALLTFYDYSYKSGLIQDRIRLEIWGEEQNVANSQFVRQSS